MPGIPSAASALFGKIAAVTSNAVGFATGSTIASTITVATITASVATGAALSPPGREFLSETMARAPQVVRDLPGVEAVAGPLAPRFTQSVPGFHAPLDVAVSPDGQFLYVVEGTGEREVQRVPLSGGPATQLVPPKTTVATRKPTSVAVGPGGTVYVVDRLRFAVDLYGADGQWLGLLPPPVPAAGGWDPLAVSVDAAGNVYVTNAAAAGPTLAVYSPAGVVQEVYPTIVAKGVAVSFAAGVAVYRSGRYGNVLVLSDSNNRRLVAVANGGETIWTFGDTPGPGAMGLPRGIVTIGDNRSYVVDATDHTIAVWRVDDLGATFLFRVGSAGIADNEFLFPNGIAVDREGRLYVADRDNDRVQVWR